MKRNARQPDKLSHRYVDFDKGWRPFLIALLVAAVLGIGFRLYFSPERLKAWVSNAIAEQKKKTNSRFALAFESAELRLSRGWQPQFAVLVKGLKVAPAPECRPEPSLQIAELNLPLRLMPLLTKGKFSVGTVSAEGMTVDLDGLKDRCVAATEVAHAPVAQTGEVSTADMEQVLNPEPASEPRWWDEKRLADLRSAVEGIDFSNVELVFEKKTKHLFLDSLNAELTANSAIDFATEVRIPPETSFGEKMPALLLKGTATAKRAEVSITARVDEGELEASATLQPQANRALSIDAVLGIGDLPLSTVVPLMRKIGLASERFQPRFLWLNCSAKIKGTFQKVFDRNPLYLDNCSLEGDGTKLTLAQATRRPNGAWDPFTIKVEALDLGKFLKTVGGQGPDGISSQFGRVRGAIDITTAREAKFRGSLQSAELSFSSGRVRAQQGVDTADLAVDFDGETYRGSIRNVVLRDGEARGKVDLEFGRGLRNGTVRASIETIKFSQEVQNLLLHGKLGALSGEVLTRIEDGRVSSLTSKLKFAASEGRDIKFEKLELDLERRPSKTSQLVWKANGFALQQQSRYFQSLKPVFLTHEFDGDWVELENLSVLSEITPSGVVTWKQARATLERDQISLQSSGTMARDRQLSGSIEVDFPKARNLKWNLSGSTALPLLTEASPSLKALKERVELDDQALGLVKRR